MGPRLLHCARSLSRNTNCIPNGVIRSFRRALSSRPSAPMQPVRAKNIREHAVWYSKPLHTSASRLNASRPPKSRDRGPKSKEDTQTDFGVMDVLRNTAPPATSIDACTDDGFALNNQQRVKGSGILLVAGEVFRWWPWERVAHSGETSGQNEGEEIELTGRLVNVKGQWEVKKDTWGVLDLVRPKPDLLIIGTGPHMLPLSPTTRKHISDLGIRLEVQDTRNAAAQFNLLATERGVHQVAAALIPIGWTEAP